MQKRTSRKRKPTTYLFESISKLFNNLDSTESPSIDKTKRYCEYCVVCNRKLEDGTTRNSFPFDGSVMMRLYCNRCYRHELIFDYVWPLREARKQPKTKNLKPISNTPWKKMAKFCDPFLILSKLLIK